LLSVLVCLSAVTTSRGNALLIAERFEPAAGQAFSLDIDAAAGTYSQWRHDELGSLNSLRATFHVPRIRKDRKWSPSFFVGVQGEKSNGKDIGLQVVAVDGHLPMTMLLSGHLGGKPIVDTPLKTILKLDEEVTIQITWLSQQWIRISIGDSEMRTAEIAWPVISAVVGASTGEVLIDPLRFGTSVLR
jgi:hypothetical protein